MGVIDIKNKLRRRLHVAILRNFHTCKEIVPVISASLDRGLTLREKLAMELHLMVCKPCVRYLEQSKFLKTATHQLDERLGDDSRSGRLSDDARQRIRDAVKASASVVVFFLTFGVISPCSLMI